VSFAETSETFFPLNKVVKRTEEQNRIRGGIGVREMTGISDQGRSQRVFGLLGRCCERLFDMLRHWIEQVDYISSVREPAGVDARATACVNDRGRTRRKVAKDQLLRARTLELKPPGAQARGFLSIAVVLEHLLARVVVTHGNNRGTQIGIC
jgi:hypothetical protein